MPAGGSQADPAREILAGRPDQDDHRGKRAVAQLAGLRRRRWQLIDQGGRVGLRLVFEDHGPGIANIEQAMGDGFTTGKGLGRGLPGSKRLVNEFEIRSAPGEGTCVTITRWK